MKVFAAVGTQKFPFDRLIDALDNVACSNLDVFVQYGNSKPPHKCKGAAFLDKEDFHSMLKDADVVITHGGVGTIRFALSVGAKVIAVPRSASYGEHVDNHQFEIVSAFAEEGFILPCYEPSQLAEAIERALHMKFPSFKPEPCRIEEEISHLVFSWGFEPFIDTDGGSNSQ